MTPEQFNRLMAKLDGVLSAIRWGFTSCICMFVMALLIVQGC